MNRNIFPISILSNIANPVGKSVEGGLEVLNYYLTKELDSRGRKVKLFASGDSDKLRSLRPIVKNSLVGSQSKEFFLDPRNFRTMTIREFMIYTEFIEQQTDADLTHFSMVNYLPIYLAIKKKLPIITTLHMPVDNNHYQELLKLLDENELKSAHFIGLSKSQVINFPYIYKIVNNGINIDDFDFTSNPRNSLVWIGRFSNEKGGKEAIDLCNKLKINLDIGGGIQNELAQRYFDDYIKPNLTNQTKYRGFIDSNNRSKFYAGKAFINPLQWDEPFGLTMVEAMACGTPVIAYDRGSVSELIKNGATGYVCRPNNIRSMINAVNKIYSMPKDEYEKMRTNCRAHVEKNFSIKRMVDDYEKIYNEIYWESKK